MYADSVHTHSATSYTVNSKGVANNIPLKHAIKLQNTNTNKHNLPVVKAEVDRSSITNFFSFWLLFSAIEKL